MSVSNTTKTIYGYTGLYRPPYPNESTYGNSMYMICDQSHYEIALIILSEEFFRDAYRLLSQPSYRSIHIFMPNIGITMISPLFNLVTKLILLGKSVNWWYPKKYTTSNPQNVQFEMRQRLNSSFVANTMTGVTIQLIPNTNDSNFYDILLTNNKRTDYFSLMMTDTDFTEIYQKYTAIHIPYNTNLVTGSTARAIYRISDSYGPKINPFNFKSREEFIEAMGCRFAPTDRVVMG